MTIRCTIRDRAAGDIDVVANLAEEATEQDLAKALRDLGVTRSVARIDGRHIIPNAAVLDHPLTHGSIIDVTGDDGDRMPGNGAHVVVVSGPEAGAWCPLPVGRRLRLGRAAGDVLLERDKVMSKLHVQFDFDGRRIVVTDLGSSNGTLVEGFAIAKPTAITLNSYVQVGSSILTVVNVEARDRAVLGAASDGSHPFPRAFREMFVDLQSEYRLPRPPTKSSAAGSTWWRSLIPIVSGAGFALVTGNLLFLLFSALAPIVYAVDAVLKSRKRVADEATQQKEWRGQALAVRNAYHEATLEERRRARVVNPVGGVTSIFASVRHRRLWERSPSDGDFLSITVGFATRPSHIALVDQGADEARRDLRRMWGSPVNVSLAETGSVTVLGATPRARAVVRSMLLGLAVTHAPSDVNVWLFADGEAAREWSGVRWLPHAMQDEETCRIATTDADRSAMMSNLRQVLDGRRDTQKSFDHAAQLPVHVVVFDGSAIVPSADLSDVLRRGPDVGVYGIVIDQALAPDGTMGTLTLGNTADRATFESRLQPLIENVLTAEMPPSRAESAARQMAALRPSSPGEAQIPAASARLADLLSAPSTSADALAERWQTAGPTTNVLVGTTSDAPFRLDLVRDGPHGLVGGMSRSGKTEFLKTFITALAWANHPDDLNFVIVDFKGGVDYTVATSLPHVLELSSNKDLGGFERTVRMLSAELQRRQERFEAIEVSNLDAYRVARQGDRRLVAIPRLIVLIDEFAELMSTDMGRDQLRRIESMSRVGAGLGVHLLLITQSFDSKLPTQIATNAGMRLCFRVQEPGDSATILDSKIAAGIPASAKGRGYARLQGGDPIEFQSARVAGRRRDLQGAGDGVTLRAQPFATLRTAFRSGDPVDVPAPETDMFAVIETIRSAAVSSGWTRPVMPWPAPLPDDLALHAVLRERSGSAIPIGLADHPDQQKQVPFSLLTTSDHVAILGGPRADLSGVLTTIACSAAATHSPDDLHIMAVDFTGRGLSRIEQLPHCGAVANRSDSLAVRIGKFLVEEAASRRSQLALEGAGDLTEFAERSGTTFPHILVLVAGAEKLSAVANFDEPSPASAAFTSVIADGAGLGIQVIAAGLPAFGVYRPGAYIDHRVVLTAADIGDYVNLGCPRPLLGELGGARRAVDTRSATAVQICSLAAGEISEADALDALAYRLQEAWPPERIRRSPKVIREVSWPTPFSAMARSMGASPRTIRRPLAVGLDNLSGDTVWIDPADAGRSMFVAGGRRSGKSNALMSIGRLAQLAGWNVIATATTEKSPILDANCPLDAVPLERLGTSSAHDQPTVVLIDDIDRLEDVDSESVLATLQRAALVICSGPTQWFTGLQRGLTNLGVPRASSGMVLVPESFADAELVGVSEDPARGGVVFDKRPGQGFLHVGGEVFDITVPLADRRTPIEVAL